MMDLVLIIQYLYILGFAIDLYILIRMDGIIHNVNKIFCHLHRHFQILTPFEFTHFETPLFENFFFN